MGVEMLYHPQMQVMDVCAGVEYAAHFQDKGVFGQELCSVGSMRRCTKATKRQTLRDDSRLVLSLLKVRIREEEEHLFQRAFAEKVGQKLHRIHPHDADVLEQRCFLLSQGINLVLDIVSDLRADFHPKNALLRKDLGQ